MGDQPACADSFRREGVAIRSQGGDKDQEEGRGQGEDTKRDSVVKPPDEKEQAGDGEAEEGLDFADGDRHPVMGLDEHFDYGDKVEEPGHSAEMDAGLFPAKDAIEHGWEDGDGRRRVEDSRNS